MDEKAALIDLPAGTVTFLFTDIEGSTLLERDLRERYGEVLAEHQRVIRGVVGRHSGREIDTQGDSFFVVFPRARDAVAAAVQVQRELAAVPWAEGRQVRVRIGIHTGEASVADGRYVGLAVHRAARISAAGHGGQILVSSSTRDVVEDDLPHDQRLEDLGEHRLKDLPRPERLFQLMADGLESTFPPLKSLDEQAPADVVTSVRTRRPLWAAAALVGLLAVAGLAAAGMLALREDDAPPVVVVPNSLVKIDIASNEIAGVVRVGREPGPVEFVDGYVFVASLRHGALYRVDPATDEVVASGGHEASGSLAGQGDGLMWSASKPRAEVIQIRTETLGAVTSVPLPPDLAWAAVAVGGGSLWISQWFPAAVVEYQLRPLKLRRRYPLGDAERPTEITFGAGSAWVGLGSAGALLRIDAGSGETTEIPVAPNPSDPTFAFESVWVASVDDGVVSRVDPFTERTQAVIEVGSSPFGLAAGAGAIWVSDLCGGTVSRIDPEADAVTDTIEIGFFPGWLAVAGGHVWVGLDEKDTFGYCGG